MKKLFIVFGVTLLSLPLLAQAGIAVAWDFSSVSAILNTVAVPITAVLTYLAATIFKNVSWFGLITTTYYKVAVVALVVGITVFKFHFDLTVMQSLIATLVSFWMSNGIHDNISTIKKSIVPPTVEDTKVADPTNPA